VVTDFLQFVGNKPLIGHHVGFDFQMVQNAMKRHWSYPLRNKQLDTVQLVKEVLPSHHKSKTLPSNHFSLDYLCNLFQIPIEDRHTALGDAYLTAILFLRLTSGISHNKLSSLFR
jgi:DNA polymerase-3 subunit epsilon